MLQSILQTPFRTVPSHKAKLNIQAIALEVETDFTNLGFHAQELVIAFKRFLLEKSAYTLLQNPAYNKTLVLMAQDKDKWVRTPKTWKRRSQKVEQQLSSLLQHLYEAYTTPAFLRKSWLAQSDKPRQWYYHLASGGSVRSIPDLPIKLSKKMAHLIRKVPGNFGLTEGFRWAQVLGLGGNDRLFREIAVSFLRKPTENEGFWAKVIAWLVRQTDLNYVYVVPILDYLKAVIAEDQGFSLQGRTWKSMMRAMENWHVQLRNAELQRRKAINNPWKTDRFVDLEMIGEFGVKNVISRKVKGYLSSIGQLEKYPGAIVSIAQILTEAELLAEGKRMHHCVGTYGNICGKGMTSIWTLQSWDGCEEKSLLTIELDLDDLQIIQVRGKCNRRPSKEELLIIKEWAKAQDLKISRYL